MVPAHKGGWISESIFQFDPILEKMGEITVPLLETSREKLRDSDFAYSYDDGIKNTFWDKATFTKFYNKAVTKCCSVV